MTGLGLLLLGFLLRSTWMYKLIPVNTISNTLTNYTLMTVGRKSENNYISINVLQANKHQC